MQEKKVLLSIKDLNVKFRVRGRILTAIRGIDLDIYENESIAIVGESGSGKSVFTKTFAGMLESNGYIDQGSIIFSDDELSDTSVKLTSTARSMIDNALKSLNESSKLELGAATYRAMLDLDSETRAKENLTAEEVEAIEAEKKALVAKRADVYNYKTTLNSKKQKAEIKAAEAELKELDAKIKEIEIRAEQLTKERKAAVAADAAYLKAYETKKAELKAKHEKEIQGTISAETIARNEILAKEVYLSVGRYGIKKRIQLFKVF